MGKSYLERVSAPDFMGYRADPKLAQFIGQIIGLGIFSVDLLILFLGTLLCWLRFVQIIMIQLPWQANNKLHCRHRSWVTISNIKKYILLRIKSGEHMILTL